MDDHNDLTLSQLKKLQEGLLENISTTDDHQLAKLLHDLQTHQIELEMQNRELRIAQQDLEESRDQYINLYDFAPIGFASLSRSGLILKINLTGSEILGESRQKLIGRPLNVFIQSAYSTKLFSYLRNVQQSENLSSIDIPVVRKDQKSTYIRIEQSKLSEDDNNIIQIAFKDSTDSYFSDQCLKHAAQVFDSTNDGIIISDVDYNVITTNNAFNRITGYSQQEIEGHFVSDFVGPDATIKVGEIIACLNSSGEWQGEIQCMRKDHHCFPAWINITGICNEANERISFVYVFSDISKIIDAQQELLRMANHDPLTGLPNRALFYSHLERVLITAQRHSKQAAILFLDLDRFKHINDCFGHSTGDQLLKEIARRLRGFVRGDDLVARMGGDEFMLVFSEIEKTENAAHLAQKIVNLINRPIVIDGRTLTTRASIGISIYPENGSSIDELTKAADAAMYCAKQLGRNNYQYYTEVLTKKALESARIEQAIQSAYSGNQLELFYQPKYDGISGLLSGMECLLRWNKSPNEIIVAEEFIKIAEDSGLITTLDFWVIKTACQQSEAWRNLGYKNVVLSINVSPQTILSADFTFKVCQIFSECHIEPATIEFEITEYVLQTSPVAIEHLKALKATGVLIAIDDFGTGYSCLGSLKALPIDRLKIDRSFMLDAPNDANDVAIIKAIISMGHSLNLQVTAEGVENIAQKNFLELENCDELQGYYMHRPVPSSELHLLLAATH